MNGIVRFKREDTVLVVIDLQEKLMPAALRWLQDIDTILKRAHSGQIIREEAPTSYIHSGSHF